MLYRLVCLILFLCLISGCQNAHLDIFPELENQELMKQTLSVEQMSRDIDALVAGVVARHPDLPGYASLDAINRLSQALKQSLKKPLTRVEFYRVVGQLNHAFGDGHSFLLWPYQEFNVLKETGHVPFPFDVKFTSEGLLVLHRDYQYNAHRLRAGTPIKSVNGVPVKSLLANLQQYVGGETALLRHYIVARRFPVMLWSTYGWIDNFSIEFERQIVTVTSNQQWHSSDKGNPEHYWERLNSTTGYLYVSHFDVPPDEFETFVDSTFEELKQQNIDNLIIDIRDNPGGNTDTVAYLASYLADEPFRLISSLQEKLNQDNRGWFGYKGKVGEIKSTEWTDWEMPTSSPNRFTGKRYVLVGPVSYSAAIVFATTMQDNKFATLVGEPTGGYANQSAQGNLFNLPHSQLRAYVTTRLLVRPNGNTRRTQVVPDYTVKTTANSVTNEQDMAIEKALRLIDESPQ